MAVRLSEQVRTCPYVQHDRLVREIPSRFQRNQVVLGRLGSLLERAATVAFEVARISDKNHHRHFSIGVHEKIFDPLSSSPPTLEACNLAGRNYESSCWVDKDRSFQLGLWALATLLTTGRLANGPEYLEQALHRFSADPSASKSTLYDVGLKFGSQRPHGDFTCDSNTFLVDASTASSWAWFLNDVGHGFDSQNSAPPIVERKDIEQLARARRVWALPEDGLAFVQQGGRLMGIELPELSLLRHGGLCLDRVHDVLSRKRLRHYLDDEGFMDEVALEASRSADAARPPLLLPWQCFEDGKEPVGLSTGMALSISPNQNSLVVDAQDYSTGEPQHFTFKLDELLRDRVIRAVVVTNAPEPTITD